MGLVVLVGGLVVAMVDMMDERAQESGLELES